MNKGKRTQNFVQLLVQVDGPTNEKICALSKRSNKEPADLVVLAMTYAVLPDSYYGVEQALPESTPNERDSRRIEVHVARSFFKLLRRMSVNTAWARGALAARGLPLVSRHLGRLEDKEHGDKPPT